MKITWEFFGGLLTGLGAAVSAERYCFYHDIHLPGWTLITGVMLIIAGMGITRGAQELKRKERLQDNDHQKA
jgi:uncharacterized membrane protein YjjP (DUF1212 family)